MEKHITIGGKDYILTANRNIIKTINEICPQILKATSKHSVENEDNVKYGIEMFAKIDVIFYEMIKIAQPSLTKEESDKILDEFESEYNGVLQALISLAMSVFPKDDQNKKKIVW